MRVEVRNTIILAGKAPHIRFDVESLGRVKACVETHETRVAVEGRRLTPNSVRALHGACLKGRIFQRRLALDPKVRRDMGIAFAAVVLAGR